jgi:Tfp pilus assembly protein PilX
MNSKLKADSGVALVAALIITAVVFLLIMSSLYVITSSTSISGAGKRYATASEAADGAVELAKDTITLTWRTEDLPSIVPAGNCEDKAYDLSYAVQNLNNPCTKTITLPGTMNVGYDAKVTIEYLYLTGQAGSRIEFPPRFVGGMSGVGLYYKITTIVKDTKKNTTAENSVLYRFTG